MVYTVFGIDRVANTRVVFHVPANNPEQAEALAHFYDANLLVSAVLRGYVTSMTDRETAEPAVG